LINKINKIPEDQTLILICNDHGSYYSSVEGMLDLQSREILNCPECPTIKINKDYAEKNRTKVFDIIECKCSEHGSFQTTANKLIANNEGLVGTICPKCPNFRIAVNNFVSTDMSEWSKNVFPIKAVGLGILISIIIIFLQIL
jgi:hypothetical protein